MQWVLSGVDLDRVVVEQASFLALTFLKTPGKASFTVHYISGHCYATLHLVIDFGGYLIV